jgi:hypothetical protein
MNGSVIEWMCACACACVRANVFILCQRCLIVVVVDDQCCDAVTCDWVFKHKL